MNTPTDSARVQILTTGGTIEKTYDEARGELGNFGSVIDRMLERLRLPAVTVEERHLTAKDSLHLTDEERGGIVDAILKAAGKSPVVVLHGTDTLEQTGRMLVARGAVPSFPVVMTGAMRPFGYENSDALQNLTEALFAARTQPPGFFLAFHGRLLRLPNVRKDRASGHFVPSDS
jgi:L-asparaginase